MISNMFLNKSFRSLEAQDTFNLPIDFPFFLSQLYFNLDLCFSIKLLVVIPIIQIQQKVINLISYI
jgi:hypothetical protein